MVDVRRRAIIGGLAALPAGLAQAQALQHARHHGVLIRVPDLDAALAFYCDGMGFALAGFEPRAGWARLASNLPIYLQAAPQGRLVSPTTARCGIAFQTNELDAGIGVLRAAGAQEIGEPHGVAPGRSLRFADHAGIRHSLLQSSRATPVFAEPRVYNSGMYVPRADTSAVRGLIEQRLGFVLMTDRYYPPSLPYLEADRSFAFMVHENQDYEPDWEERRDPRADDLGTWQVFVAADLRAAAAAAADGGAVQLTRRVQRFAMGRRASFVTPGGAPFEIWSWT